MKKLTFLWIAALACSLQLNAKVTMPQLFQNGMVLQRNKPIPVWGKADAGEAVTVTLNKKKVETTAGSDGRWRVDLPKMKAGGPFELQVNDVTISDVLIGDVWLLSGQSNIDVTIERVYPWYTNDIDNYENPQIRLFRVQNETDTHGVRDDIRPTSINWKPVTKQNAWPFSAVGYFLGRRQFEQSGVAQGIIVNSWGGTPIEAWISADSLGREFPMLVERTRLYQSDEYVRSQSRANMLMSQQWSKLLDEKDPGKRDDFTALGYDDSNWKEVNQYSMEWAKNGNRGIVGSIWLRQHVNVDKAHAGRPARLLLGTLFDSDVTYVNGKQVGTTGYQYPPRRYDIPEGLHGTLHTREGLPAGLRRRPLQPEPAAPGRHTPKHYVEASRWSRNDGVPQCRRVAAEHAHHALQRRAPPPGTIRAVGSGMVPRRVEYGQSAPLRTLPHHDD